MLPQAGEAVGAILNGQWKLVRLVGEGGLAAVYEAHGQQGQGRRAIKMLHPQFVSQRQIVERFYAEAQACFTLRHPHIASVEAYAYAEDGSPYIVMELLEGISLEEYLRRKQPMTPELASPLLYGILQALSVAHGRGIVHRDLKPANIFLVPNQRGDTAHPGPESLYTVKVLDFGIAKVMDLAGGMGSKTRTGAVLGTPGYMSPEQVKNAKAVDARTDIWAAGVVFYEMLTCQHPFGSADQLARMVAVLRDPPTPISKVAPQLAMWDPYFEKAMSREVDKRFQSAEEMAENLRQFAQGTPARIVPDGLQTVALPMMPDLTQKKDGAVPPGAAHPSVQPATMGSPRGPSVPPPGSMQYQETAHSAQYVAQRPSAEVHPSSPPAPYSVQQASPAQQGSGVQRTSQFPQSAHQAQPQSAYGGPATQISADKLTGNPTYHGPALPHVHVMTAPEEDPPALVWWGVILVALGAFAMGTLVGYLLAY